MGVKLVSWSLGSSSCSLSTSWCSSSSWPVVCVPNKCFALGSSLLLPAFYWFRMCRCSVSRAFLFEGRLSISLAYLKIIKENLLKISAKKFLKNNFPKIVSPKSLKFPGNISWKEILENFPLENFKFFLLEKLFSDKKFHFSCFREKQNSVTESDDFFLWEKCGIIFFKIMNLHTCLFMRARFVYFLNNVNI